MVVNFRQRGRDALARARIELISCDPERVKYAALELRMAIEAVTYDRANSYRDELPETNEDVWQPRKLMTALLNIEPHADHDIAMAFGLEDEPGVPSSEMTMLGQEKVFNLRAIKSHYDALGSYLHSPTVKQLENKGDHEWSKLKSRCEKIIALLDDVLTSPIFNINFAVFSEIRCNAPDCRKPIKTRALAAGDSKVVECPSCSAIYEVSFESQGVCRWRPLAEQIHCPNVKCDREYSVNRGSLKPGSVLDCDGCGQRFKIGLAWVRQDNEPE